MTQNSIPPPGWAGAVYALGLQSCLGFAYYGFTANIILLLQTYAGKTESHAESLTNYLGAVAGLTPLLGGFLSDKVIGCFNTILLGGSIFLVALVSITLGVHFEHARALIMPMLFLVLPLGYGLLTANVNIFGAYQFLDAKDKTSWFSWFYFSSNTGSIVAFLVPGMIQQNYSFTAGLALPCAIIAIGLATFANARSRFSHPTRQTQNAGDHQVAATSKVWGKILPAILLTIVFSICYSQMQTTWYVQGLWMNRKLFGHDVPVSYMMCADPLFVMLAIYFLEGYIFPVLRKAERMPTPVSRMGLGMLFSCGGMLSAYHVEKLRLREVYMYGETINPSPASIFLQVPQFALVAFAEVFVYTTIQDYAFSLAPDSMKASINAANLFAGAVANVIAGMMATYLSDWIPPNNPNLGHYDQFYLLLGLLCLIGAFGFHSLRECSQVVQATAKKTTRYGTV
jgi:dipeptide/tripeptide permease